jgi:hypothetical protein
MNAHERETDKLIAELRAFRSRKRERCDHMIYDGFAVQIQMLKNLGIRLDAVDDAEQELYRLALEIFPDDGQGRD